MARTGMGALDGRVRMSHLLRSDVNYERPPGGGGALFDLVGDLKAKMILDLGCGLGSYRSLLEGKGAIWIGCDLSTGGCNVVADGGHLPFRADSFDGILSSAVLEHLPEPDESLVEMWRVLRPGGRLFGYVAFLEPLHGMSYFHMSHLGFEYLLLKHGFRPRRIFPAGNALALHLERILFPKRLAGVQPVVRALSSAVVRGLLFINRSSREILTLLRRLPADVRRAERTQYRLLLALRYAAGFNFIAQKAELTGGPVAGYRALVKED